MKSRVTNILPLLLIALLCIGLVEGVYQLLDYVVFRSPVEKTAISESTTPEQKFTDKAGLQEKHDYRIISERNLFGPPPGEGEPKTPVAADYADDLKLSSLNIVLMGTVNGGDGDRRAIILDKSNNKQELYEKGDTIQGAIVKEILRGKVILVYNDKDEMLDMNEAAKERSAPAAAGGVSQATRPGAVPRQMISPQGTPRRIINRPRAIRPSRSIKQQ